MMRRLVPIALLVLVGGSLAYAQQAPVPVSGTELILSWRSNGSAPPGYAGRVAASGKGTVLLTLDAISNGRPVDLSRYEIRWYMNDDLIESGVGMQTVSVPIPSFHEDGFDARAEIIGSSLTPSLASLSVPLTDPIAVIEPQTGMHMHAGDNTFHAAGYSFNVTNLNDLVYQWTIDGEVPQGSEDPRDLVLNYDGIPVSPVTITLKATHPQNQQETASAAITLPPVVATTL